MLLRKRICFQPRVVYWGFVFIGSCCLQTSFQNLTLKVICQKWNENEDIQSIECISTCVLDKLNINIWCFSGSVRLNKSLSVFECMKKKSAIFCQRSSLMSTRVSYIAMYPSTGKHLSAPEACAYPKSFITTLEMESYWPCKQRGAARTSKVNIWWNNHTGVSFARKHNALRGRGQPFGRPLT